MSDELLLSADSHVIEDPQLWEKRLPHSFQDQAPVFPELKVGGQFQARPGGHDPKARLSEMAEDGVSGEVLYPSFCLDLYGLTDAPLQEACFRVYNDWIIEYCSAAPDRLFGIGNLSCYNIPNAVKELERCKAAGLRGAPGTRGPCLHDLRHTFAVRSLEGCAGADRAAVARHMLALSTYLGHAHVTDTQWYLQATPALMAQTAGAGEAHFRGEVP